MRVGLLSSWRVPCGIYQYTARLADAMANLEDVEPVILAGRADEHRSVSEESQHEVYDAAKIGLWRDDREYELLYKDFGKYNLDVIHVQYQSMLFNQEPLADMARAYDVPMAITFHDNCQRPDFPYGVFDLMFSHRLDVGPRSASTIPFGIECRPPIIRTFGLGRSDANVIRSVCNRHGWTFEDGSTHETIRGGGQKWRTNDDLIDWLRGADAIVLWYAPQSMAGSSQAVRTAIASRRPVYTNNTEWFSDLPKAIASGTSGTEIGTIYYKCDDEEQLETRLKALFNRHYVNQNSWDLVAKCHIKYYKRVLCAV